MKGEGRLSVALVEAFILDGRVTPQILLYRSKIKSIRHMSNFRHHHNLITSSSSFAALHWRASLPLQADLRNFLPSNLQDQSLELLPLDSIPALAPSA